MNQADQISKRVTRALGRHWMELLYKNCHQFIFDPLPEDECEIYIRNEEPVKELLDWDATQREGWCVSDYHDLHVNVQTFATKNNGRLQTVMKSLAARHYVVPAQGSHHARLLWQLYRDPQFTTCPWELGE